MQKARNFLDNPYVKPVVIAIVSGLFLLLITAWIDSYQENILQAERLRELEGKVQAIQRFLSEHSELHDVGGK